MRLSIIIPVYNSEKYLVDCIESIINQPYKNFEVILVDDGSSDNSGKICDDYSKKDNRIKVIHKENGGVSTARNLGLQHSTGKYVTFVDSDDMLYENFFTDDLFSSINDDYDILFFGLFKKSTYTKSELINTMFHIDSDRYSYFSFPCSKFFSRKLLIDNNIYFPIGIINGEDMLFNIDTINYAQKMLFINKKMYLYRINNNSVSRNFNIKIFESDIKFNELLSEKLNNYDFGVDVEKIRQKNICNAILMIIDRLSYTSLFDYKKYINNIYSDIYIKYINDNNKVYIDKKIHFLFIKMRVIFPLIIERKIIHLLKGKRCFFEEV